VVHLADSVEFPHRNETERRQVRHVTFLLSRVISSVAHRSVRCPPTETYTYSTPRTPNVAIVLYHERVTASCRTQPASPAHPHAHGSARSLSDREDSNCLDCQGTT
jgi:hypothetical protein